MKWYGLPSQLIFSRNYPEKFNEGFWIWRRWILLYFSPNMFLRADYSWNTIKKWFERLTEILESQENKKILDRESIFHWTFPVFQFTCWSPELYLSSDTHSENLSFQEICLLRLISIPDGYFDLVLADEELCPSCLLSSFIVESEKGRISVDSW